MSANSHFVHLGLRLETGYLASSPMDMKCAHPHPLDAKRLQEQPVKQQWEFVLSITFSPPPLPRSVDVNFGVNWRRGCRSIPVRSGSQNSTAMYI